MKETVLFRVDGGKVWGISMGHIKSSTLLAEKLKKERNEIVFIMKNYEDGVNFIQRKGFNVVLIDIQDNSDETLINICDKYLPSKIIFDLYTTPYTSFFDYAKKQNIRTIVFDTKGRCCGDCDILINDSIVRNFTAYNHLKGHSKLYIGPDYFLMEKSYEFLPIQKNVQEILITMGGSDPAGLTLKVVDSLKNSKDSMIINVVLGPGYTDHDKIHNLTEINSIFRVFENPAHFIDLLSCQDIVITSGGRTLYECAHLGRPVIILPSIDHEAKTAEEFEKTTGSINVNLWNDKRTPEKIKKTLEEYISNYELRDKISKNGRKLVDGKGLNRIINLL